jgi:formyl-CoA transferase
LLDICNALGLPDLSVDPRFNSHDQRVKNKAELHQLFRDCFAADTREHWLQKLEEQDLLSAPVRDMREALVDPQTLHNGMILDGGTAGGRPLRFIASPIQMSGTTTGLRRKPPRLGEHTLEILDEAMNLASKAAS